MTPTYATDVWQKLLGGEDRIVTSDAVARVSADLGREYTPTVKYLQQEGYITRIFRGVFYVNTLEERTLAAQRRSVYRMVAEALVFKGARRWYFALETALKMNGMTHEYFATNYVITDAYRTTKVIGIDDLKFKFIEGAPYRFGFGIVTKDGLRYSDMEKTVLDLVADRLTRTGDERYAREPLDEYRPFLNMARVSDYLGHYPARVRSVAGVLD